MQQTVTLQIMQIVLNFDKQLIYEKVQTWAPQSKLLQKYAFIEKSAIFRQLW